MLDQIIGVLVALAMIGFGLLLGGLAVMLTVRNVGDYVMSVRSRRWPTVHGEIISSQSEWIGARARSLRPDILYTYNVDGTVYYSKRITFGNNNTYVREEVEQLLKQYAVGATTQIYYDPGNPRNSTLQQTHRGLVSGLIVSAMLLLPTFLCSLAGGIGLADIFRVR